MKVRYKILTLLGLLALVAVWFLSPRVSPPVAARNDVAVAPSPSAPVAATVAATNSVIAEDLGHPSAATTNRLTFRLANTSKTATELAGDRNAILLENASIDTTVKWNVKIPTHLKASAEPGAYLVQSRGQVDVALRSAIGGAGGQVISYIPNNAFLVQISAAGAAVLAENPRVQAVLPFEPYYKVSSTLLGRAVNQQPLAGGTFLTLGLYDRSAEATLAQLKKMGAEILTQERSPFGQMVRVRPPQDWVSIAQLPGVQRVEAAYRRQIANDLARPAVGVAANSITSTNYLNLSGSNVLVVVADSGIDATHPDLMQSTGAGPTRVLGAFSNSVVDIDGHGTHVAGIIAGNGFESTTVTNARGSVNPGTNFQYRGSAPLARLYSIGFLGANDTNIFVNDSILQELTALTNALIMNNSWRYTGDNEYDLPAASYDAAMRDALPEYTGPQPILAVFAAGNEGGGNDAGSGGSADTIASPATAKNVITVGALEELRNITNQVTSIDGITNTIWTAETDSSFQVAGYSSRGNVGILTEGDYGRFKPDVVAPGTFTISTRSTTWDMNAFYNVTNYHVNTVNNAFVATNALAYGTMTIPNNAVGLSIRVVPNSHSPSPFPGNFPIYVSTTGTPDPADLLTYDFARSNNLVAIPPDNGGTITDISVLKNGGLSYAVVDPYTNASALFDIIETIITTNDLGNQLEVMSNLNNTISPWYRYESGTSMSAPAVSGVLACIQDFFTNRLQLTPSPALLKAMVINGARVSGSYKFAVTNTINYQGWGLVKLSNSVPLGLTNVAPSGTNGVSIFFVDQSLTNALATGDRRTYNVSIPTTLGRAQPLRVTLAWTDPPGNPAAAVKLVNDLDLLITNNSNGQVFFGNQFSSSGTPPFSVAGVSNSVADNINNVENIYLSPTLGTNYSITVYAKAVNVNAVTLEQTNVVQDFALVVTSGDGNNTNGFTVTAAAPQPTTALLPHVEYLPATNGIYFNRMAGANAPWLNTNDLALAPGYGFYTNAIFHVGQTNQWHFFVVTNTFAATNANFTNAAFIVFLPNTQATPREGVFADSTADSTRPEADLELLVASVPEANAGQLTNLDMSVISNCLFNASGCASAIGRGGSEFVVFTNSMANQIYYIGVQCQDQMAGQFAFVPIFTDQPFSSQDGQGNVYVNGLLLPATIPDGNNAHPGVAYVFGLCTSPIDVNRVIVTNTFEHQNFGDLYGALSHESRGVILNNHVGLGAVTSAQEFIYDDSGRGDYLNSQHTDGPGSLTDFRGTHGVGAWIFNVVDNSYTQTGAVTGFKLKLEPHRDLKKQPFSIVVTVPPGGWFYDYIDVPVGYTNMLVVATNLPPTSVPPIELYVKEGDTPSRADTNYMALLVNGTPPGNSVSVGPPLVPDRYFIGLYNPDTVSHDVLLGVQLTFDSSAVTVSDFASSGVLHLLDDAVTYASLFVTDTNAVQNFQVGLRVDHERISDLVFHLIRPDGTRYLLMENRGGQSTNGCGVTIITTNIINQTANGGSQAETNSFSVGITHGTFPITYNFYTAPDQMTVYYGTNVDPAYLIFDTGMTNNPSLGPGAQNTQPRAITVSFPPPGISANSTYLTVVMNQYGPTPRSTAWVYTAGGVITNYVYLSFTENTNLTTTPIKFAPPPFVPKTVTNTFITTNLVNMTGFARQTNITYYTNVVYSTNVTFTVSNQVLSTFESATAQEYLPAATVDGWTVLSNQVTVVNDVTNALGGTKFLALASGSVSRNLPTLNGMTNTVTFICRGPGALGWWRGEGNINDSVNAYSGALKNTAGYAVSEVGNGFNLDGVNGYVLVQTPANSKMDAGRGAGFTFEGWVYPTNFAASRPFIGYERVLASSSGSDVGVNTYVYLTGATGGMYANIKDTSGIDHTFTPSTFLLSTSTWQHFAFTYDKVTGNGIFYLNGAIAGQQNMGSFTPQTSYTNILIGGRTTFGSVASPSDKFSGKLDEVSIYGRALSPSEIKAIYQRGTVGKFDVASVAPGNLAEATLNIVGKTTLYQGVNTNWQTNTFTFVGTSSSTPFRLTAIQPGMLMDSFTLTTYQAATNSVATATNYYAVTNIFAVITNAVTNLVSTFEPPSAGAYTTFSAVDGWTVVSNQVSVVSDSANAQAGSKFTALANGSMTLALPTVPGLTNILMFSYRGPGVAGFWRGDSDANDAVSINNGILTNGASLSNGLVNQTFSFNGSSQFVKVPAYANLNSLGNRITIDFWMFANSNNTMSTIQGLMDTDHYGVEISYGFGGANGVNFYVDTTGGSSLISSANGGGIAVTPGQWHHIAGAYDSTKIQLYIDGVPAGNPAAASGNIISMLPSSYLGIGSDDGRTYCGCGGRYFWGLIDEATLYRRDLSPSEIKAIYNAGIAGKYENVTSFPYNLAKARASLVGVTTNLFYGANTNWQTYITTFVPTANSTTLQLDGLQPGMLLDSLVVANFIAQTNYVTNTVVVTSNLCYLPEQDISAINGINPYGEWKLEILDNRAGATNFSGNLLSWQMEFTYANTNFTLPPTLPNLSTNYYSVIESNLFIMATNTATSWRTNATFIYALVGAPTNATINPNTGVITWFPLESQAPDTNVFVVTVYDPVFPTKIAQNYFQVVAIESNLPPQIISPASNSVVTILEPDILTTNSFNILAYDPDLPTNDLTYSLVGIVHGSGTSSLAGLVINPTNGLIEIPLDETSGPSTNTVTISVSDHNPYPLPVGNSSNFTATSTFTLVIQESNRPPVLFLPPDTNITEELPWSAFATATDPDIPVNTLTFAPVSVPVGFNVAPNGLMTWTPTEAQGPGVYTNYIRVTDFNPYDPITPSISVTNFFVLTVNEWNIAPTLATNLSPTNIYELQAWSFNNPATDPDTAFNTVFYTLTVTPLTNAPAVTNAVIDSNTGFITWTPLEEHGPGDYLFTTIATDSNPPAINQTSFSVTNSFIVHVLETNSAPFWTTNYPNVVMDELTVTNIYGTAIDTDLPPNTLTYVLPTNAPPWVTVNPTTGDLTLSPLEVDGPSTNIITVFAVDDGSPSFSTATSFTVVVNEVNLPPTLPSVNDQLVYAGELVAVDDSATDLDVPLNTITYTLLAGPPGLSLDANTGLVLWQTTTNTPQGTNLVMVQAADYNPWALINQSYSVTNSFNIIVLAPFTNDITTGIPAFPGAEGAGGYAIGGRGGDVYHVTNLNDDGPGSLRYGLRATHRTIVFDVSGTINLRSDLRINRPFITIAGQTAPGDGITLMGRLTTVQNTHDVGIRFLRFRAGDTNCPNFQDDSFHFREASMSIVDHLSASWSIDEVLSATYATNVTVQWSMITDALNDSCHDKGLHGYGSLLRYGDGSISYHHNLYADNYSRNPRLGDNITLDFVNNVVANWGILPGYSADDSVDNPGGFVNKMNYVGNYLIAGSNTVLVSTAFDGGSPTTIIYQSGNYIDSNLNTALDGVNTGWGMFSGLFTQTGSAFTMPAPVVTQHPAPEAYERVLAFAGATATKRDLVDSNVVRNVRAFTGHIINSQYEVGGWPALASAAAPLDTDQDGMPDYWETLLGLNKNVASDGNLTNSIGYTRLEEYLDWMGRPHAFTSTNTPVDVDLQVVAGSTGNLTFTVANGTNGTVILLPDNHTARFTPTTDFGGFGSFAFNVNNTTTGNGFGPVTVSVVVIGGLVVPIIPVATNGFMLVQYNVKGNGAADWSTNAAQVQAIGRELRYLNPDIITFNEIPDGFTSEMSNWAQDFLAGYTVMVSPGTDGFIHSAIATKFPVIATNSWLDGVDLNPYGYSSANFTRDLFEAQILVPGYSQPLHVLTTHLKSSASGYTDAALKRAAEAAAIANFIATNLMVLYPNDPYTLSGDLNESNTNTLAIQRLINSSAGLRLTNPTNQLTGSINTFSSSTPSSRIDYVLPCTALASNVVNAQVFRTSVLNPVPSGLNAADDQTASDHLPVFAMFGTPYGSDFPEATNDVPVTNTIPAGGIRYIRVRVPVNADLATNTLLFSTGPVDVWFTTNTPPSIARANDSLLMGSATSGSVVLDTNNAPAITPNKTYYLGIHNLGTSTVTNAVLVTFHLVTLTPPVFNIFSIVPTNSNGTNGFIITWFAPTNYQFHLQWTPQLAPQVWTEMKGVISFDSFISATNSHFSYFDDGDTNRNSAPFGPTRFYRLHLLNSPTNTEPEFLRKLTVTTNFYVGINTNFALTNAAIDWDIPPQTLSYSVFSSVVTTNPVTVTNGLVQWTPVTSESGTTNIITTIVRDNGVPQKSATNSFTVVVTGGPPAFSSIYFNTNGVNFVWYGTTNQQFQIEWTTNLAPPVWTLFPDIITSTNGTFTFVDTNPPLLLKFYRLLLLP